MAETLTPQQEMAVTNRGGKLLVSAAAGSGKTKVLVDRLLRYITDPVEPANIDDFLIITYTKAAASELRGKIADKLTQRIAEQPQNRHLQQQMQRLYLTKISTVHAFCGDILREFAYRLDISADFRVAEENECVQLQEQVLEELLDSIYASIGENPDLQAFVDTQGFGRDDRQVPQLILKVYHSARCHLNPEQWLSWCESVSGDLQVDDASTTPWGAYLIGSFHEQLQLHLQAMERCVKLAAGTDGMENPRAVLEKNVAVLKALGACKTWDALHNYGKIEFGRLVFPKNCKDTQQTEQIKAVRNACKAFVEDKMKTFADSSSQVLADLGETSHAVAGLISLVRGFSDGYERLKRSRRVLDFGDLEHKMLQLLLGKGHGGKTALADEIGSRFREIMVDEYQDSNEVQDAIFSALTDKRQNCFMVGDVKQSIYQFRLADPSIFLQKYNTFAPAEEARPGEGRKVLLSRNFRSAGQVIAAVNDVFTSCMSPRIGGLVYGADEKLYEGIPHVIQQEPEVELYGIQVREDTYEEEAAFTAQRITELLDGSHYVRDRDALRPIKPEDIVILLRSPGSVGAEFQYALEQRGIRCETGAGADLLQTEEISSLRALLQTIHNPLQDIPVVSVLASRFFGFSADLLAEIRGQQKHCPFIDAVKGSDSEKCQAFLKTLELLRKEARMNDVTQLLQKIFAVTRIDSIYAATHNAQERNDHLQAFCKLAADWQRTGRRDLGQFLDYLDSLEQKGVPTGTDQKASDCVTIMSIHKSKGLEFPVVFLCGLSRGFNHESARAQVLCDKELGLGLACVNIKQRVRYPTIAKRAISTKIISDTISEELRVEYVAMTRAKDRLIMTYAHNHLDTVLSGLSNRMDLSNPLLMTGDVSCPGTWVLYTAMMRTEAGEFFALGGKPDCTRVSEIPWKIRVVQAPETVTTAAMKKQQDQKVDRKIIQRMKESLAFRYPYEMATVTPSKLTATQLKGRFQDQEAAEDAVQVSKPQRIWRSPSFCATKTQGKDYGNAMHAVMQYIQYGKTMDEAYVKQEIRRLNRQGFLTDEQADLADAERICRFFQTDVGRCVTSGREILREFKFSVLVDADETDSSLKGEKVLLQGVIDCAVVEGDGITVIDFKTDYVTNQTLQSVAQRYYPQVSAYGKAIERIYQKPVKRVLLYFFHCNAFVKIK